MRLDLIADAVRTEQRPKNAFSILLYGETTTGKTRLAATLAKVPWIEHLYWFDIDNGSETLVTMVKEGALTVDQAMKILIYQIPDSLETPMVFETVMKCLTVKADHVICDAHGKISCVPCATKNERGQISDYQGQKFNIGLLTDRDVLVLDSGSALADSILNHCKNTIKTGKNEKRDQYAEQGTHISNLGLVVQGSRVNIVVITHTLVVEVEDHAVTKIEDNKTSKTAVVQSIHYPLMGTRNMCAKFGKYFGNIIYMHKKMNMHKAASGSTYQPDVLTGSRAGWRIEDEKTPDFATLFEKIGIRPTGGKK